MSSVDLVYEPFVAREIAGDLGANLRWVAGRLGIEVAQRGGTLRFTSEDGSHEVAVQLFESLAKLAAAGRSVHPTDVRDGLRMLLEDRTLDLAAHFQDVVVVGVGKRPITARTLNQRAYVAALRRSDIVFGVGPAGTGKTYLAVAMAVARLRQGACKRILLTRPAVEAGEKLGFLPGDLSEKVDPYLRPLFDALADMIEPADLSKMMERGVIEVAPLAFMRGRTLNDACVVLDEAQNTTVEQMQMFLTRLGDRGRMVVTGDVSQVDLPRNRRSGLAHALQVLQPIQGIEVVRLTDQDVMRHPLVAEIIRAYEADREREREGWGE
jgi:phosphate starvation-inducible PhoH-like protein